MGFIGMLYWRAAPSPGYCTALLAKPPMLLSDPIDAEPEDLC